MMQYRGNGVKENLIEAGQNLLLGILSVVDGILTIGTLGLCRFSIHARVGMEFLIQFIARTKKSK